MYKAEFAYLSPTMQHLASAREPEDDLRIQEPQRMLRPSIKRKIVGIATGMIFLAVITSVMSMALASRVGHLLDELTNRYIPAYGDLARVDIRSLERALTLRRMIIAKMQTPPDEASAAAQLKAFGEKSPEVQREAEAARNLIKAIIADPSTPSDDVALTRIDDRIDTAVNDLRHRLDVEIGQLHRQLEGQNFTEVLSGLARVDSLYDEFNQKMDLIRADMLGQVHASASTVIRNQQRAIWISAIVTAIAATLGFMFAMLVGSGITRPVYQLLEGTREVEAGRFDKSIPVTTRDEIGQLSIAFNGMIERLRNNERIREIFGKYIDPRVAQDLLDQPAVVATQGQRRVMTVMFCDMKGFTTLSEGVTPQGLVKVMNRYLSMMSEPIRSHRGIIDKYIGDAIMAYWGAPFVEEADQARFACLAAIDMVERVDALRQELPELLGVRSIPMECDIRIGIATGEALVGSIGSEFMMSYTVMGDTVNLASRLEVANKAYGTHCLVTGATVAAAKDAAVEVREIDRVVVLGQSQPQVIFEIMGRTGELASNAMLLRTRYEEGLTAYRAEHWDEARAAFNAGLAAVPDDGPSTMLVKRIDDLQKNGLPPNWDGSWRLDSK
jgi:class 3 adenylate cyclase